MPDPDQDREAGVDPDVAPPTAPHPFSPVLLVAVAGGGAAGALARDGISRALNPPAAGFPNATLLINVSGSLLLGVLLGVLVRRTAPAWVRLLVGTGFCGGFTTFSTFGVETDRLVSLGRPGIAVGYVAASLAGAAVATLIGLAAGRRA